MVDIFGDKPFALINWMADVPTYITRALMSWILYLFSVGASADPVEGIRRFDLSSDKKATGDLFLR